MYLKTIKGKLNVNICMNYSKRTARLFYMHLLVCKSIHDIHLYEVRRNVSAYFYFCTFEA
jgi:hypothetical protein